MNTITVECSAHSQAEAAYQHVPICVSVCLDEGYCSSWVVPCFRDLVTSVIWVKVVSAVTSDYVKLFVQLIESR